MRHRKIAKWLMLACFATALVLWLGFGGRSEFVAKDHGPYSPVVYFSGWIALAGLLSATVLTVSFFGSTIAHTAKRNAIRYGMRGR
ncbi:hypothetical protein [Glutamicibacter sp.]|uniref:hypothetical protein n=1 Tax=Glutamicibacter sp. TaxID=1931995 RepID=UPI0028BEE643|nr:hypothetical protein [Glutamicibacter sp.]